MSMPSNTTEPNEYAQYIVDKENNLIYIVINHVIVTKLSIEEALKKIDDARKNLVDSQKFLQSIQPAVDELIPPQIGTPV